MKRLFFGLYMVSCEDLGLRPNLESYDLFDREIAYREALEWLAKMSEEKDFERDARYISPGFYVHFRDQNRQVPLLMTWANLGFRLMKFDTSFVRPPQVRDPGEGAIWNIAQDSDLGHGRYVLPVTQFKMLDLVRRGGIPPKQFQEICDKANQDPDKIEQEVSALNAPRAGGRVQTGSAEGGEAKPPTAEGEIPAGTPPGVPPPGKQQPTKAP